MNKSPLPNFYEDEPAAPTPIHDDTVAPAAPAAPDTLPPAVPDTMAPAVPDTLPAADTLPGDDTDDWLTQKIDDPLFREEDTVEGDTVTPALEDDIDPIDQIQDPRERESFAQKEAKRRGREAKEMAVKIKEMEIELATLREAKPEPAPATTKAPTIAELREHPDVHPLIQSVNQDIETTGLLLSSTREGETLKKNFGAWMQEVVEINNMPIEDRREKMMDFKSKLENEFGDNTTSVMQLFMRNVNKTLEIGEKLQTLKTKAEKGVLASSYSEYESMRKEVLGAVDEKTLIPDDLLQTNPDSVEALVTTLVKSDPKWSTRFEKAKEEVLHLMTGGKVYSQAELDKLAATGHDVAKFLKDKKNVDKRRAINMASILVQGLMLQPLIPEWSKKLRQTTSGKKALETLESMGRSSSPTPPPPKPKSDAELFSGVFG